MKTSSFTKSLILLILTITFGPPLTADEVYILAAVLEQQSKAQGNTQWSASVTLEHNDSGWDHYADEWRVVDGSGQVLGSRVLLHPHIDEQPFTRSANNIAIPNGTSIVYIEAHDTIDGWMEQIQSHYA